MRLRTGALVAAAAASLAACGGTGTTRMGAAPVQGGTAESACARAVNANMAGGSSTVVGSESAAAGTVVTLRSNDGTGWRCVAAASGVVVELSVV